MLGSPGPCRCGSRPRLKVYAAVSSRTKASIAAAARGCTTTTMKRPRPVAFQDNDRNSNVDENEWETVNVPRSRKNYRPWRRWNIILLFTVVWNIPAAHAQAAQCDSEMQAVRQCLASEAFSAKQASAASAVNCQQCMARAALQPWPPPESLNTADGNDTNSTSNKVVSARHCLGLTHAVCHDIDTICPSLCGKDVCQLPVRAWSECVLQTVRQCPTRQTPCQCVHSRQTLHECIVHQQEQIPTDPALASASPQLCRACLRQVVQRTVPMNAGCPRAVQFACAAPNLCTAACTPQCNIAAQAWMTHCPGGGLPRCRGRGINNRQSPNRVACRADHLNVTNIMNDSDDNEQERSPATTTTTSTTTLPFGVVWPEPVTNAPSSDRLALSPPPSSPNMPTRSPLPFGVMPPPSDATSAPSAAPSNAPSTLQVAQFPTPVPSSRNSNTPIPTTPNSAPTDRENDDLFPPSVTSQPTTARPSVGENVPPTVLEPVPTQRNNNSVSISLILLVILLPLLCVVGLCGWRRRRRRNRRNPQKPLPGGKASPYQSMDDNNDDDIEEWSQPRPIYHSASEELQELEGRQEQQPFPHHPDDVDLMAMMAGLNVPTASTDGGSNVYGSGQPNSKEYYFDPQKNTYSSVNSSNTRSSSNNPDRNTTLIVLQSTGTSSSYLSRPDLVETSESSSASASASVSKSDWDVDEHNEPADSVDMAIRRIKAESAESTHEEPPHTPPLSPPAPPSCASSSSSSSTSTATASVPASLSSSAPELSSAQDSVELAIRRILAESGESSSLTPGSPPSVSSTPLPPAAMDSQEDSVDTVIRRILVESATAAESSVASSTTKTTQSSNRPSESAFPPPAPPSHASTSSKKSASDMDAASQSSQQQQGATDERSRASSHAFSLHSTLEGAASLASSSISVPEPDVVSRDEQAGMDSMVFEMFDMVEHNGDSDGDDEHPPGVDSFELLDQLDPSDNDGIYEDDLMEWPPPRSPPGRHSSMTSATSEAAVVMYDDELQEEAVVEERHPLAVTETPKLVREYTHVIASNDGSSPWLPEAASSSSEPPSPKTRKPSPEPQQPPDNLDPTGIITQTDGSLESTDVVEPENMYPEPSDEYDESFSRSDHSGSDNDEGNSVSSGGSDRSQYSSASEYDDDDEYYHHESVFPDLTTIPEEDGSLASRSSSTVDDATAVDEEAKEECEGNVYNGDASDGDYRTENMDALIADAYEEEEDDNDDDGDAMEAMEDDSSNGNEAQSILESIDDYGDIAESAPRFNLPDGLDEVDDNGTDPELSTIHQNVALGMRGID